MVLEYEKTTFKYANVAVVVDDKLTVVTYKRKTVQSFLTEIAGLLVLSRFLQFFLLSFHEWRFNKKMKKEAGEEFREVFTYPNFKKTMV
jgi:hypothetical protein